MADFNQEQLHLIAKALEHYYYAASKGYQAGDNHSHLYKAAEIMAVRYQVIAVYGENLGSGPPLSIEGVDQDKPYQFNSLVVGAHYRVVEQDHRLDGQRVKLERIETDPAKSRIRTWVVNGILEVLEVPSTSLVECQ